MSAKYILLHEGEIAVFEATYDGEHWFCTARSAEAARQIRDALNKVEVANGTP